MPPLTERVELKLAMGALPAWSGGPLAGQPDWLFLQRQNSGARNTWLESWAPSFRGKGLCECWNVENGAGGPKWGACKSTGILVGGLCSSLCILSFSGELSENFVLPFPSELLPPVATPVPATPDLKHGQLH